MLDENLPTFYLRQSTDKLPHHGTYLLSVNSSTPEPAYAVHRPDPKLAASHNMYSIALLDPYVHDVVFAEVLMRPEWNQPTLSQEEIRRNGGIPPPPQPIPPTEFTIQLYNPEQQVTIRSKSSSWGGSQVFDFEMPMQTFRIPSLSSLDRSQNDPHVDGTTPLLSFRWKRDSRLSKDMSLLFRTSQIGPDGKRRRSKEPDITVALFQHFREVTIYEPNFTRIDLEDMKGMELVILLSAVAIRDLFFMDFHEVCNITTYAAASAAAQASGNPLLSSIIPPKHGSGQAARLPASYAAAPAPNGRVGQLAAPPVVEGTRPPPADPLTQWQIDAETARLKKEQEAEKKSKARREKEERARLKKQLEAEEKERRRREAEVAKETERLKKLYGVQGQAVPDRRNHVHFAQAPMPSAQSQPLPAGYATSPWSRQQRPTAPPHQRRQSIPQHGQQQPQHSGWFSRPSFGLGHHANASQPVLASGAIQRPSQQQQSHNYQQPSQQNNSYLRPSSAQNPHPLSRLQQGHRPVSPSGRPNFYSQPLAALSSMGNFLSQFSRPPANASDSRLPRKRSSVF